MSNHASVWKLRKSGNNIGWLIGCEGWRKPEREGHDLMPYALDNGMYFPFGSEPHGPARLCEFFGRCGKALQFHDPLFAVVPDMPYDATETMKRYTAWIKRCRELAPMWRWGIAVQNGMTPTDVERLGVGIDHEHDAICVGGSSEWKDANIRTWGTWCRERRVWCHVLRVNDTKRLELCQDEGVNSVDGTGLFPGGSGTKTKSDLEPETRRVVGWMMDDNNVRVPIYARKP
jgi:hypothetical protein